jgi:hypothetical protein
LFAAREVSERVGRARWSKITVDVIRAGIEAGLKKPTATLGFLELGARVLDKTDDTQGKVVHFHLHTNVDIYALGKAREQHGLPPIARRVAPESNE